MRDYMRRQCEKGRRYLHNLAVWLFWHDTDLLHT